MKDFNEILFGCINETLGGVLGFEARDAIYFDLLSKFSVRREELPSHVDSLLTVLKENLGQTATRTISRAIARRLRLELHIDLADPPESDLDSYVREVKSIALRRSEPRKNKRQGRHSP